MGICRIEKPDFELRKAILKQKIYKDGLDISEDVIDYIAENVSDNIRNLEGVLISLLAHATLTDVNIDLKLAETVIGKVVSSAPKIVSVEQIRDIVCDYYSIPTEKLMSSSRKREIPQRAKWLCIFPNNIPKIHSLPLVKSSVIATMRPYCMLVAW